MSEELVTIRRFNGSAEANLWKLRLKTAGISAVVVDDFNTGASMPSNALLVKEKDVQKAQKVLKSLKKSSSPKVSWASTLLLWIFGVIMVIPGIVVLVFSQESQGTILGIILVVFGGVFLLLPVMGIVKRKKLKNK
jgi:hypothetical protein